MHKLKLLISKTNLSCMIELALPSVRLKSPLLPMQRQQQDNEENIDPQQFTLFGKYSLEQWHFFIQAEFVVANKCEQKQPHPLGLLSECSVEGTDKLLDAGCWLSLLRRLIFSSEQRLQIEKHDLSKRK